jgi:hypothetical protein
MDRVGEVVPAAQSPIDDQVVREVGEPVWIWRRDDDLTDLRAASSSLS